MIISLYHCNIMSVQKLLKIISFCLASVIAFFASLTSSTSAVDPIAFSTIPVNYALGFDSVAKNSFTCPQSGIYWFFYTILWTGTTEALYTFWGTDTSYPLPQINRLHVDYKNYDTLSRESIRYMNRGQKVTASTLFSTYATTTTGSSFGGFMLNSIMSPLVRITHFKPRSHCLEFEL